MIEFINKTSFDFSKIEPNVIYNRIDLFDTNFVILHIANDNDYYVELLLKKSHAELGAWLMHISYNDLNMISSFVFLNYSQVEYISFYNVISDRGFTKSKFFYINLPSTYMEIEDRLNSKSRQTLRRKKRNASEMFGEMKFTEYNKIPDNIVNKFFQLKEETLNVSYHLSCQEYINKYHVSNAYVLSFGEKIASIFFTCEQCQIVYFENFSYDNAFASFSPGMLIYDLVIEQLIRKGKKCFFLGGGNYDYKRKYHSIEVSVCEGRICRNFFISIKYHIIDFYNRHLFWKIRYMNNKLKLFF